MILTIFVIGMAVFWWLSRYIYQKTCLRREKQWPDLATIDNWERQIVTEAYKIKNEPNRKITITSADGVKLVAHYYERKKNAAVIIFFHGLRCSSYLNGVPIYKITEKRGWNLLLVSLRAHDESGGNISTLGVLEKCDCCDWANWVASEFGERVPIYLMGISMGGAAVLMSSDLNLPKSVCGIIDDAAFTTPLEMIKIGSKNKLHYELLANIFTQIVNVATKTFGGFDLKDADTCAAVSKTSVPILIIHGDKDTGAPLAMAYRIYNSCQSKKEIYVVLGAEHTECYRTDPEKYEKTVSEFIEKNLP